MTPEELLGLHPLYAAKVMAAEKYGAPATPDWFVIRSITASPDDPIAEVVLELNELFVPISHRYDKDPTVTVTLKKMSLGLLSSARPLVLSISPLHEDKTYADLLKEKFNHLGLIFTDDDFEDVLPEEGENQLNASAKSLRWFSTTPVTVNKIVEYIDKYIKRREVVLDYKSTFTEDSLLSGIIDVLNKTNSTELPLAISHETAQLVSGVPREVGNETDRTNTEIDLSFSYPYAGELTVRYNRRSFHRTYAGPVQIKDFGTLTMDGVIEKINSSLDAGLTLEELEPFEIPKETVRGEVELKEGKYRLFIKGSSIAHVGEIWIELIKDYVP